MTDDRDPTKMLDEALDLVIGLQKVLDTLIHRIRNLEHRMGRIEAELEPQLIMLTKLMEEFEARLRPN